MLAQGTRHELPACATEVK